MSKQAVGSNRAVGVLQTLGVIWLLGGSLAAAQTRTKPETTPTPPPRSELHKHIEEVRTQPEQVKDVPVADPGTRITPAPTLPDTRERNLPPPEPNVNRPSTVPELAGK